MNISYTEYALKQKNDFIENNDSLKIKIESLENTIKSAPNIIISGHKIKYEDIKYNLLYRTITDIICSNIIISGRLIIYFININNDEVKVLYFARDTLK